MCVELSWHSGAAVERVSPLLKYIVGCMQILVDAIHRSIHTRPSICIRSAQIE